MSLLPNTEILHAAFDAGKLSNDDNEEQTVSVLAAQLSQVWRDNPEFVAYMDSAFR